MHPNIDESRSQGVSVQAAVLAPGRPGNPATCRRDAGSTRTDVRRVLALQTDRQIRELSVEDNKCALLLHGKGVAR